MQEKESVKEEHRILRNIPQNTETVHTGYLHSKSAEFQQFMETNNQLWEWLDECMKLRS